LYSVLRLQYIYSVLVLITIRYLEYKTRRETQSRTEQGDTEL
jgi:hypothetical protein